MGLKLHIESHVTNDAAEAAAPHHINSRVSELKNEYHVPLSSQHR